MYRHKAFLKSSLYLSDRDTFLSPQDYTNSCLLVNPGHCLLHVEDGVIEHSLLCPRVTHACIFPHVGNKPHGNSFALVELSPLHACMHIEARVHICAAHAHLARGGGVTRGWYCSSEMTMGTIWCVPNLLCSWV